MEIFRALGALAETPGPETARLAAALELGPPPGRSDYSGLFLLQLYPYASVYLGAEGMMGGEARDRIGGFWRALELVPPPEPDHLALMLSFHARLAELEDEAADDRSRQAARQARKAWLWEHLLSWLPVFLDKLDRLGPDPYRRWGELLRRALAEEAARLGPPRDLALHLRSAPQLPDPRREGGEAFLGALLAPVRSGLVLVRADLERAARELGLGARAGERAFTLKALMSQDSGAVLGWLVAEAAGAGEWHRRLSALSIPLAEFWAGRAERTARLLDDLRAAT